MRKRHTHKHLHSTFFTHPLQTFYALSICPSCRLIHDLRATWQGSAWTSSFRKLKSGSSQGRAAGVVVNTLAWRTWCTYCQRMGFDPRSLHCRCSVTKMYRKCSEILWMFYEICKRSLQKKYGPVVPQLPNYPFFRIHFPTSHELNLFILVTINMIPGIHQILEECYNFRTHPCKMMHSFLDPCEEDIPCHTLNILFCKKIIVSSN